MIRRALLAALLLVAACGRSPGPAAPPAPDAPTPRVAPPASSPEAAALRPETGDFALDPRADLAIRWPTGGEGFQPMSYAGSDGDRVPALLQLAPGRERLPAILLGHGHGASAEYIADHLVEGFAGKGVHLLAPDHPFHGERRRHERGDLCPDRPELLVARWLRAVKDLRRAVAVLRRHPRVDPRRIGYVGFSLGGVLGGLLAANEPDLAAVVLVAPAGGWKELAASPSAWKLGWNRRLLPEWLKDPRLATLLATVDPARTIARFAPRPLLIVAGRSDTVIRPEAAEALHRAAGKGAEIAFHPGGHGPGPRALRHLSDWILGHLRTAR